MLVPPPPKCLLIKIFHLLLCMCKYAMIFSSYFPPGIPRIELRSSSLCSKFFYLLSHLPDGPTSACVCVHSHVCINMCVCMCNFHTNMHCFRRAPRPPCRQDAKYGASLKAIILWLYSKIYFLLLFLLLQNGWSCVKAPGLFGVDFHAAWETRIQFDSSTIG